jgi:hypothetical protein
MDMDTASTPTPVSEKHSFINFVVQQPKNDLSNLLQYAGLATVPAAGVVYAAQNLLAPIDLKSSSGQLAAEAVIGLVVLLVVLYFANRMIMYVPTYSGMEYAETNMLGSILPFLVLLLIIDDDGSGTSIGSRVKELIKRIAEPGETKKVATKDAARQQPQQQQQLYPSPGMPPPPAATQQSQQSQPQQGGSPDFNAMYESAPGANIEAFNSGGGYASF